MKQYTQMENSCKVKWHIAISFVKKPNKTKNFNAKKVLAMNINLIVFTIKTAQKLMFLVNKQEKNFSYFIR